MNTTSTYDEVILVFYTFIKTIYKLYKSIKLNLPLTNCPMGSELTVEPFR